LTDSEIFGWDRPRPRSRNQISVEAPESDYADLNPGDWWCISIMDWRYRGLVTRVLKAPTREFLQVNMKVGTSFMSLFIKRSP